MCRTPRPRDAPIMEVYPAPSHLVHPTTHHSKWRRFVKRTTTHTLYQIIISKKTALKKCSPQMLLFTVCSETNTKTDNWHTKKYCMCNQWARLSELIIMIKHPKNKLLFSLIFSFRQCLILWKVVLLFICISHDYDIINSNAWATNKVSRSVAKYKKYVLRYIAVKLFFILFYLFICF